MSLLARRSRFDFNPAVPGENSGSRAAFGPRTTQTHSSSGLSGINRAVVRRKPAASILRCPDQARPTLVPRGAVVEAIVS
jgi:hypothetical protein